MTKIERKNTVFLKLPLTTGLFFLLFAMSITSLQAKSLPNNNQIQSQQTISGVVKDANGLPLSGANIVEKGTSNGVMADFDGKFSITPLNQNAILVVSYIGYTSKEVKVNGQDDLEIFLEESASGLDEVVVVGYGVQKKSQVTGAISSVSSQDIQEVPVVSLDQALQGRAAGVDVIASSNAPGSGATVRIRGVNSIKASNSPLFVLDGIPISGGLSDINPNSIASMEVLKDASATAIYGARGSNGVVLITTKKGKKGETRVTYDGYAGFAKILNKVDVLDGQGWVDYRKASRRTDDLNLILDPTELANYQAGNEVDWQDLVLRDALQQSHSIGVSGGNEKTAFSLHTNYLDQQGIVLNSDFKRGSIQINIDHNINDRIKIGASTLFSTSKANVANTFKVIGQSMELSPLGNVRNDDGTLRMFPTSEALIGNPLLDVENDINQNFRTRIFSSIYAEWEFLKGLKYRINFGPDFTFGNEGQFLGSNTTTLQGGTNRASNSKFDTKAYTLENLLIYNGKFGNIHDVEVTLLQSIQEQFFESNWIWASGIPSDKMRWHDLSAGQIMGFDTNQENWSILSYMARINYTLRDKYLITLTTRRDGSSRFGENKKFGFFPSMALGWRIINEDFMKGIAPTVSELKLRASYGTIGNTAINPYRSLGALGNNFYIYGTEPAPGFEPDILPNPELQWESSSTFNLGLDFGFFNNRLHGTFEYYQINTSDLLLDRSLPSLTGYTRILSNIGATRNTGYEVSLSSININHPNGFKWSTDLNFSINKNEIIKLYGDGDDVGNNWFIGQPINVYYNKVFDGIWQENEAEMAAVYDREPGEIRMKDLDGDNKITASDRQVLGSSIPKWSGGITNRVSYKGLELSVFINTRQDFLINSDMYAINNLSARYNIPKFVNYYTDDKPSNDFPRPVNSGERNLDLDVLRYQDGSYVRIKNINLGYNFSDKLLSKTPINSLRFYINIENPYTFTQFEGWDPEAGGSIRSYPSTKSFLFGISTSF